MWIFEKNESKYIAFPNASIVRHFVLTLGASRKKITQSYLEKILPRNLFKWHSPRYILGNHIYHLYTLVHNEGRYAAGIHLALASHLNKHFLKITTVRHCSERNFK